MKCFQEQPHIFLNTKNMFKSSCTSFNSCSTKKFVWRFSWPIKAMKNIFDGWCKNFVQESNAVILLHLRRSVESPSDPKSLAPILGIVGNFSIFLHAAKLCVGAFGPVLQKSSGILSPPEWSCELALAPFWHPHLQKCVHMTFLFLCVCFQKVLFKWSKP